MFVLPDANAVRTPLLLPMVATPVLLLDQVPPDGVPVKVWVAVAHIGLVTENDGTAFTVSTAAAKQPAVECVQEIVVVPAEVVVTVPPELMVPTAVLLLDQSYPVVTDAV